MSTNEKHIIDLIKQRIHQKNPLAEIVLFGSHARGDARSNSDWDILILLNKAHVNRSLEKAYRKELFDVELEIGEPISTFVFSKKDWETRHLNTPFYENVKRDGIPLL